MPPTEKNPHFVLLPFMAQGHLIPMVDIARLLARRRALTVTILLTPLNYQKIQPIIDRAIASGLSIHVSLLNFPCTEAGLPEGCESFDMLRSMTDVMKFFGATTMLKEQVRNLLIDLNPSCLIGDMGFIWSTNLALELGIPRIIFHGTSCFSQVLYTAVQTSKVMNDAESDTNYFVVPDLPDRVQITVAQLRGTPNERPDDWEKLRQQAMESERNAFGTLANTFEELEPEYIKRYAELKGHKVWSIGPVSLCNEEGLDKAERGNKAAIDEGECLKWLGSMVSGSVLYVCLGSLSQLASPQLIELGLALEASNHPFVWGVRGASEEFKVWLKEEKFEERIKTRPGGPGLLIHGWAPQVLILSHPSVGGFLTHCGWNSTLEGITAGLPMVTWPIYAEQFCNEKFVVDVIKTGVKVGVEMPVLFGEEEKAGMQVKREEIRIAVDEIMDGGDEGNERRERAQKLGETAKRALTNGEPSGSLYANMTRLIQDVQSWNSAKLDRSG